MEQILWLAICLYHEARGEPKEGQVAVAHVVLNRVEKDAKSVKDVVLRPWQFSWANNGARPPITDYAAFCECVKSVAACFAERLEGKTFHGADHYFADYITVPKWAARMKRVATIGRHIFYRNG